MWLSQLRWVEIFHVIVYVAMESAARFFSWGISSVGRAPALQAGCQEFESPILHSRKGARRCGGIGRRAGFRFQ